MNSDKNPYENYSLIYFHSKRYQPFLSFLKSGFPLWSRRRAQKHLLHDMSSSFELPKQKDLGWRKSHWLLHEVVYQLGLLRNDISHEGNPPPHSHPTDVMHFLAF